MPETLESPAEIAAAPLANAAVTVSPATAAVPLSFTGAALARCLDAYRRGYQAAVAKGDGDYFSRKAGAVSYRLAMPSTETTAHIQALIACVAQGINYQVYEGRESTQLLYAAQVALFANKPPKAEKTQKPEKK